MLLLSIIQKFVFMFFEWNTFPFNSFPDVGWSAFDSMLLAKQPPRSILFMKSDVTFYKQKHPSICDTQVLKFQFFYRKCTLPTLALSRSGSWVFGYNTSSQPTDLSAPHSIVYNRILRILLLVNYCIKFIFFH